ncbi:MAG: large-conductance mechanosensitive channel protein MscL [Phycisphaerales bacterium]|nr:large-conductance mechanosensitive channel protein MscL [Phycisphaerales bacterium]
MRGNVVDMAVGIIIGLAFGKIVTALVDRILMPPIGWILGGVDFGAKRWIIGRSEAKFNDKGEQISKAKAGVEIGYGEFINTIINFVIVAFALFLLIKLMNQLKKKELATPAAPPAPAPDVVLLSEIRDLLKQGR